MKEFDISKFYQNGYEILPIQNADSANSILKIIQEIESGKIQDGFSMISKYPRSKDLRPEPLQYSNAFTDFIEKNGYLDLIQKISKSYKLAHVQLRKSEKGSTYMNWHRDTYCRNNNWIGHTPPVLKIIFYPMRSVESQPKIKVIPRLHRLMIDNYYLDKIMMRILKNKIIHSSNQKVLFFDTALPHAVYKETLEEGSYRLIYSFCHEDHLHSYKD